ncbi:MAG TPA: WhiB family transcriptional regulator [Natronosporangium sp.]|nr:WhiB family transcriptional regulator [Natronosporangium sp.]
MTRARTPRPHEVEEARRDQRLLRAIREAGKDPAWRTRGACQSVDPETFFPAPSEPVDAAMALCRTCPVQGACLAWALQAGDLHGVWGGTTARERRAMAVIWHSEQREALLAEAAAEESATVPHQRTLPPVGAAMDRAELLRLVKAG